MSVERISKAGLALALGAAVIGASACSGGGSGGVAAPSGGITTPPPPPPPPPPPASPPSTSSAEYLRNPALALIGVEHGWAAGATGDGVTVAVIDDGIDSTQSALQGRVIRQQGFAGPYSNLVEDYHGTFVATVLAANFNGSQSVGVAYEADLLDLRVDKGDSCATDCQIFTDAVADAVNYARLNGADIINMSLGTENPSQPFFQNAMQAAVDAGVVIVTSAGNEGAANPTYPGRYAADPRFAGSLIVVGALNAAGTDLASFSNRAGDAAEGYIAAPGEGLYIGCDDEFCYTGSGTSFASPLVAGTLALLLDAFPNISGSDAVEIVLDSARDMGAPGIDPIYGRGALDVQAAFQPMGTLSLPSASGTVVIGEEGQSDMLTGAAFGDALASASGLETVIYDRFERMFEVDLGAAMPGFGRRNPNPRTSLVQETAAVGAVLPGGAQLRLSAAAPRADRGLRQGMSGLVEREQRGAAAFSYVSDGARLDFWSGEAGGAPAFAAAPQDAYSALAQSQTAARLGWRMGAWTLSAEQGFGARELAPRFDYAPVFDEGGGTAYSRATLAYAGKGWRLAMAAGALREESGPLGSFAPAGSALAMPADSRFASLTTSVDATQALTLSAQGSLGQTDARGAFLSLDDALSSSWRLAAVADCQAIGLGCTGLALTLSQPIRIERARITAVLADQPQAYFDPLTFSRRDVAIAPSDREIDLGVSLWRDTEMGQFRLDAAALINEGHVARDDIAYGVGAGFHRRF
jgi:hypothetical protein